LSNFKNFSLTTIITKSSEIWKLLKEYLEVHHGVATTGSPKMTLKNCVDAKLITPQEYKECLGMIGDRNLSSHAYNVVLADEIAEALPRYYELMGTIAQRIKPT
jgi:hypothetical protein